MDNIQELKRKRAEKVKEARALLEKAEAENRAFTDDERSRYDVHKSDIESLTARIDRAEEQARMDDLVCAEERIETPKAGADDYTPEVKIGDERFMKDPKKGFATPRDFILAVMNTGLGRRSLVAPKHRDALKRLEVRAAGSDEQGEYANPYGGYLVPEAFSPNLLKLSAEADPLGTRTTNIPLSAPSVAIPARVDKNHSTSVSGGLRVYRSAETQSKTASRMELERIKLDVSSLFGMAYVTEELLADSPISFAALLEQGFRDEFLSKLVNERINGTGVGEYLGILNAPCKISITKETSQVADTIVWPNIVKMRARCWGYENAIWLYNHDALPQLMNLVMPIGTAGVAMWQSSAREGEPDLLLGRPAIATEYCDTVGDEGDLILGNWTQYLEGTYQPLQSAESIHVRFEYHERVFKFWTRNAGAPWWRSPLTTKNSTNTLSPFVTLGARA